MTMAWRNRMQECRETVSGVLRGSSPKFFLLTLHHMTPNNKQIKAHLEKVLSSVVQVDCTATSDYWKTAQATLSS